MSQRIEGNAILGEGNKQGVLSIKKMGKEQVTNRRLENTLDNLCLYQLLAREDVFCISEIKGKNIL